MSVAAASARMPIVRAGPGRGIQSLEAEAEGYATSRESLVDAWADHAERGAVLAPLPARQLDARLAQEIATDPGRPVPPQVRAEHERRLGWDLGAVRVHAGEPAARAALSRGARALASGTHIVLGAGEYAPATPGGRRLLGHELAHTVQADDRRPGRILRQALSVDWAALARRLMPAELEAAVLRLRQELAGAVESSEEGLQKVEQLSAYEAELLRRQGITQVSSTFATGQREQVRSTIASTDSAVLAALLAQHQLTEGAKSTFTIGLASGMAATVPPGAVEDMINGIVADPGTFYGNYLIGLPVGLWHGLSNLVTSMVDLVRLAYWLSPVGLVHFATEQLFEAVSDPDGWTAARRRDAAVAEAIRTGLVQLHDEFSADPTIVLQWSADLGEAAGSQLGTLLTEFLRKTPAEQGRMLGDFVGQVLWEVLLEIVLLLATQGVGNAIRAAGVVAQGARVGGRLAQVLRRMIEAVPAVRRLIEVVETAARGVRSVGRTVDAVDTVGDVVRTAEQTANAVRAADQAGDAVRAADQTGDAVRAADQTGDAVLVADQAGDATRTVGRGSDAARSIGRGDDVPRVRPRTQTAPTGARAALPPGVVTSAPRQRALAILDALPAEERSRILAALDAMEPAEAGPLLTRMGQLDDVDALVEALATRRPRAAGLADTADEGLSVAEQVARDIEEVAPSIADLAEGGRVIDRPPVRVDPQTLGVSRSALKSRMRAAGLEPSWASGDPGAWNPHHLIPVEHQNHPVLDVLRNNGGWDHNTVQNGIALPTRPGIPGAEQLPMHQVSGAVFDEAGLARPAGGVMADLRGHPVLNERVGERLDALREFMDRPAVLRQSVDALLDTLRTEVSTSVARGRTVQF